MIESMEAAREQERLYVEARRLLHPEAWLRDSAVPPSELYRRAGISGIPPQPAGFIRFFPQDFIVEEITTDGEIATIEPSLQPGTGDPSGKTFFFNMVKCGLGTLDAVAHTAHVLQVPLEQVRYAGLKDGRAVTSQRISVRGMSGALPSDELTQLTLKLHHRGKGALGVGQLRGNRFTIFVRTQRPTEQSVIEQRVQELAENGFANFYGVQRFGNRFLNPYLGMLLCQGNSEEALRIYLSQPGQFDIPAYRDLRLEAAAHYGDWKGMRSVFDRMPFTFRHERILLAHLSERPTDIRGALLALADQVRFWVYGYNSFLVNQLLSTALQGEVDIPDPLPLPFGGAMSDELYAAYLQKNKTTQYSMHLKPYPFIVQKFRTIMPWIMPEIHHIKTVPAGVILSFSLPKGVYATTFLMFLFELYEGSPVPTWVKPDEVDTKALLGTGSVAAALDSMVIPPDLLTAAPAETSEAAE